MKKIYITIVAIILCVTYGVLSWDIVTHSEPPGPEDSEFAESCSSKITSDNAAPLTTYDMCCIDFKEALNAVKLDWQENLQAITDQERPASEMVEDGYESLRTYNCWTEYICRAVQYSGFAPIESNLGTGLKEVHLGIVPGCQSPDNLRMGSQYNQLIESMKEIPIVGVPAAVTGDFVVKKYEDFITENKLNYFPRCQTDQKNNNRNSNLIEAKNRYDACKREMEFNFCPSDFEDASCIERANAFVTLETILKKAHGNQKASALEKKLGSIVPKLHIMETHVGYLSNFLEQLDARFSCYAGKCT